MSEYRAHVQGDITFVSDRSLRIDLRVSNMAAAVVTVAVSDPGDVINAVSVACNALAVEIVRQMAEEVNRENERAAKIASTVSSVMGT